MIGGIHFLLAFIWRKPATLIGLVAASLALGFFCRLSYQQFLYLQAQSLSRLSVFNEMIVPLSGLTLLCQLLMLILIAVQLVPNMQASNQKHLLVHSGWSSSELIRSLMVPILSIAALPLLSFLIIALIVASNSALDLARLSTTTLALASIHFIMGLIVLAVCWRARNVLLAFLQSSILIIGLLVLETSARYWWPDVTWQGLFKSFLTLREGLVSPAILGNFLGWIFFGVGLNYWFIHRYAHPKKRKALAAVFLGVVLMLSSGLFPGQWDLTSDKKSTLSKDIAQLLANHPEPLNVTAIIDQESNRDEIIQGFKAIQAIAPNSKLRFRGRQSLHPQRQISGEYLEMELGELHQVVTYPFDQDVKTIFETAISQMLRRKQDWIVFVEGHGEANLFSKKASDLTSLFELLRTNGWPVSAQNLRNQPQISDNTRLLVIAASKQQWLAAEEQIVLDYLNGGGNLLLLLDPDSYVPAGIGKFTGIVRYPGTLVDWNGYQKGTPHPAVVMVDQMSEHPVVNQLNSLLAFPWASGLKSDSKAVAKTASLVPVVSTHSGVWNELDIELSQLAQDEDKGELRQAFAVVVAYEDQSNQQKIIVVGDSHFASDSAINNYANKQFTLNLMSWLTSNESRISSQLGPKDNSIAPSQVGHFLLNWGIPLGIPILILSLWLGQRWRRRVHSA